MRRFLWILPLCLILQDAQAYREIIFIPLEDTQVADDKPGTSKIGPEDRNSLNHILVYQPTQFLQMCMDRYDREVRGYNVTFCKQELVAGKLRNPETIKVAFREKPFSVFFDWQEGAALAQRILYVEGKNDGQMRVRSNIPGVNLFILTKDPDGSEAKDGSRYTIKQFGMHQGTQRSLASMRKAEKRGKLFVEYKGVFKVPQLNNRECYKFIRKPYDPLEEPEKILNELILYIDTEYWLQTGSILRDAKGGLIAEYFFRDLQLNPTFPADQFTEKKL